MFFPEVEELDKEDFIRKGAMWLIASEGFEMRSLALAQAMSGCRWLERAVIFKNIPHRRTRLPELKELLDDQVVYQIDVLDYPRDDLATVEQNILPFFREASERPIELVVDISVMSRALIVLLVVLANRCGLRLQLVYSEPMEYAPSETEFLAAFSGDEAEDFGPSTGFGGILRAPSLSSPVMATSNSALIAFCSFNKSIARALRSEFAPSRVELVNGVPPIHKWREEATAQVFNSLRRDWCDAPGGKGNKAKNGYHSACTLDYRATLQILRELYAELCFTHRIVLAPTGSKMQAVACGIARAACSAFHVEYPAAGKIEPKGYSSDDLRMIHRVDLSSLSSHIAKYSASLVPVDDPGLDRV